MHHVQDDTPLLKPNIVCQSSYNDVFIENSPPLVFNLKPQSDSPEKSIRRIRNWVEAQQGPLELLADEMPPESPEFAGITPEYIQECRNYISQAYKNYGKIGSTVCSASVNQTHAQQGPLELLADEMPPESSEFAGITPDYVAKAGGSSDIDCDTD
ncbi:hypothetical protein H4R24_005698 [Coemansia sp. RSA 988]|nr:hypothetical protein H4R24_005698 [Coemansia sp. RSA 988]